MEFNLKGLGFEGSRFKVLGLRVYPTGSFPGMVFSGIYRVSLFFLCFSLKGFRTVFSGLIPIVLLIMKMRCIVGIF